MKGFTLLEVLLALALFSIIAIASVEQITLVRNTKVQAQEEGELYNGLRAAITLMKNDFQQAFHVQYDDLSQLAQETIQRAQPIAHTLFDGRKNQIVFTSLSHRNFYANRRESDQAEISFFLQPKPGAKLPSLMKRESGKIDDDMYAGGGIYTILDNVSDLQFQFWDEKIEKWVDDWNSDGGTTRDRFPYAIKMKVSVQNAKNKELKVETSFKVAFANNEPFLTQF